MGSLKAIAELLNMVLDRVFKWLDERKRQEEYEAKQAKRDAAASDPAGAFADHFGGVRPVSTASGEAAKADSEGDAKQ